MTDKKYIMVFCTCPDQDSAASMAENIVAQHLAACINIVPGIKSIYQWQGNVESAQEALMLIKTDADKYDALQKTIKTMHPYEIPEVIQVDISNGLPEYLSWIDSAML